MIGKGFLIGLFLLLAGLGLYAVPPAPPGAVHVITVAQAITPATKSYIGRALAEAIAAQAEVLIIELDTPGGLLSSTREIVQQLLNTRMPVVVYIAPAGARGASAGTMITMASHVAAMAPATHIGAAHPVSLFGGGDDKVMAEKIVNDTSAFIESVAELRGRNVEWAISSVRESKSITARKALELNVVELIADDLTDLVKQLDGRVVRFSKTDSRTLNTVGRPILYRDMSFSQGFMALVSNPNLVFLFLIVGLVGLYIEFSNPGMYLPGILGAISLLIALVGMQTLPVSYGALGLMLLGVALLVAESFVPSFGVLGIGGLASLLVGSVFLLDESQTDLRVSLPVIISAVASVGVVTLVIGRLLVKSFHVPPRSFQSNLVGQVAEVREDIAPDSDGKVFLNGELWTARAEVAMRVGERVSVTEVDGLVLRVEQYERESVIEPHQPDAAV
ncbi:MAG: nodulation protein NfeD [SAR324 cluster bacterium]|nr:nodulation protein NfeD [SAR324 cluster bacterium]